MINLKKYIDQKNAWNKIFGEPLIDFDHINQNIAQTIFSQLNGELSPENLHCDGEITADDARRKAIFYYAVGHELMAMGFTDDEIHSEFFNA